MADMKWVSFEDGSGHLEVNGENVVSYDYNSRNGDGAFEYSDKKGAHWFDGSLVEFKTFAETRYEPAAEKKKEFALWNVSKDRILDVKYDPNYKNVTIPHGHLVYSFMVPTTDITNHKVNGEVVENRVNVPLKKEFYDMTVYNTKTKETSHIERMPAEDILRLAREAYKHYLEDHKMQAAVETDPTHENMIRGTISAGPVAFEFTMDPKSDVNNANIYVNDLDDEESIASFINLFVEQKDRISQLMDHTCKEYLKTAIQAEQEVTPKSIEEKISMHSQKNNVGLSMPIDWSEFTIGQYSHMINGLESGTLMDNEIIGQVGINGIKFNVVVSYEEGDPEAGFEDPRTNEFEGFTFDVRNTHSFEQFKSRAGMDLANYALENSLIKAPERKNTVQER